MPLLQEPTKAAEHVEPVDQILREGHDYFQEPWTVDGSLPATACPMELGVCVDMDVDDKDLLANIDKLRAGYQHLANADALMAEQLVPFALCEDKDASDHKEDADDALVLASSFYTMVMNIFIECLLYEADGETERAVVSTLDHTNCVPKFWRLIEHVCIIVKQLLSDIPVVGDDLVVISTDS